MYSTLSGKLKNWFHGNRYDATPELGFQGFIDPTGDPPKLTTKPKQKIHMKDVDIGTPKIGDIPKIIKCLVQKRKKLRDYDASVYKNLLNLERELEDLHLYVKGYFFYLAFILKKHRGILMDKNLKAQDLFQRPDKIKTLDAHAEIHDEYRKEMTFFRTHNAKEREDQRKKIKEVLNHLYPNVFKKMDSFVDKNRNINLDNVYEIVGLTNDKIKHIWGHSQKMYSSIKKKLLDTFVYEFGYLMYQLYFYSFIALIYTKSMIQQLQSHNFVPGTELYNTFMKGKKPDKKRTFAGFESSMNSTSSSSPGSSPGSSPTAIHHHLIGDPHHALTSPRSVSRAASVPPVPTLGRAPSRRRAPLVPLERTESASSIVSMYGH